MIFLMINPPYINGAHDQDRTGDLILTKDVLYRLSYVGWLLLSSKRRFPPLPIRIRDGHNRLHIPRGSKQPHTEKMERETGFEPATLSLEG